MSDRSPRPDGCLYALASGLRGLLDYFFPLPPRPPEQPCPPEPGKRPLISFVPADILFVVAGDGAPQDVARFLERDMAQRVPQVKISFAPRRVTQLRGGGQQISLAVGKAPALRRDPKGLVALVGQINGQIERPPPEIGVWKERRAYVRGQGARATATLDATPAAGAPGGQQLTLLGTSPNWLGGASQRGGTGAGPGGRPVPMASPGEAARGGQPSWDIRFKPDPANTGGGGVPPNLGSGAGVRVLVLDTAHTEKDLREAHARWVLNQPEPHPLLARLLGVDGSLTDGRLRQTIHAPGTYLFSEADYHIEDHAYPMPDHGLFAAGIITTLAPEADIYLVEVLNPYGVGTFQRLIEAFELALRMHQEDPARPLVVNCSLVLNMPQPDAEMIKRLAERDESLAGFSEAQIEEMIRLAGDLLDALIASPNVYIVAAAGNDGSPALPQPPGARVPASLPGIAGVAALGRDGRLAAYSNRADAPEGDGFATFGGDGDPATGITDPANGIVGVYIGPFPEPEEGEAPENTTGWARWAGTSFATPVIAGLLASILSANPGVNPWAVLRDSSLLVDPNGEVVPVEQPA